MDLSANTRSRAKVLELRQRAEIAVAKIHDHVVKPEQLGNQSNFKRKIACVVIVAPTTGGAPGSALVGTGRLFYRLSSDFMHGRSNMLVVQPAMLAEWEALVSRLEELAKATTK